MRLPALAPVCVLLAALALPAPASDLIAVLGSAEQMDPLYREAQAGALSVAEGVPQARADTELQRRHRTGRAGHHGGFRLRLRT
jgi:hypothetical protein